MTKFKTSFRLNSIYFTNIESYVRKHANKSKSTTRIYIIKTTQVFPEYNPGKVHNFETDKLYYLKLKDLKNLVNGKSHIIVKKLKGYVQRSLYDLIKKDIIK
jgi:hypothetical protein